MLECRIVKYALSFFGHIDRADVMELQMMFGKNGRSTRKRQTTLHLARQYTNITNIRLYARDRAEWRIATLRYTGIAIAIQ